MLVHMLRKVVIKSWLYEKNVLYLQSGHTDHKIKVTKNTLRTGSTYILYSHSVNQMIKAEKITTTDPRASAKRCKKTPRMFICNSTKKSVLLIFKNKLCTSCYQIIGRVIYTWLAVFCFVDAGMGCGGALSAEVTLSSFSLSSVATMLVSRRWCLIEWWWWLWPPWWSKILNK